MWKQRGFLFLAATFCVVSAHAEDRPADVLLLSSFPSCMESRLGPVSVSLGNKDPNLNSRMSPAGVSYRRVFDDLLAAAAQKGANAVVLRGHQADFFSKGSKRATRPTYVLLEGTAVVLKDNHAQCSMRLIDPLEFERNAITKPRTDIHRDMGSTF